MRCSYFLKRLALIPITLFGIIALNFAIVQIAPGGPVEQMMMKLDGMQTSSIARITGGKGDLLKNSSNKTYRGGQGLREELRKELEIQFGFDKPASERFILMLKNYLKFDFGKSFYKNEKEIILTGKENSIMKLFMDNVNHVFSKDMLYELIWGNDIVDDNAIMVYINKLRQKIEDDPDNPKYIQTMRGIGYRFIV